MTYRQKPVDRDPWPVVLALSLCLGRISKGSLGGLKAELLPIRVGVLTLPTRFAIAVGESPFIASLGDVVVVDYQSLWSTQRRLEGAQFHSPAPLGWNLRHNCATHVR